MPFIYKVFSTSVKLRREEEKELTSSFTTNDSPIFFCQYVEFFKKFWILGQDGSFFEQVCLVLKTLFLYEGLDLF